MKSKIGLSVGIIAAAAYFLGLIAGYVPLLLIVGYVLICEENRWLKIAVVKALLISLFFSVVQSVIGFIPNFFTILTNLGEIFDQEWYFITIPRLVNFFTYLITILEKVIMLLFGFMAIAQKTIRIAPFDNLIKKVLPADEA
jgi:hypothetical protein